jgi:hypothetical protein
MKRFMVLFCLLVLSACAPRPTIQEWNAADFGPSPVQWREIATAAVAEEMLRPENIRLNKIMPPVQAWTITPDGEKLFAWAVCGLVVMNSHLEPFAALIHYDRVIYKAVGLDTVIRSGKRPWVQRGIATGVYGACPGLWER